MPGQGSLCLGKGQLRRELSEAASGLRPVSARPNCTLARARLCPPGCNKQLLEPGVEATPPPAPMADREAVVDGYARRGASGDGMGVTDESTDSLLAMPEAEPADSSGETWRNWAAWWVMGLTNNVGYVVFLTAAEAIIAGGAGIVLAADILPVIVIKPTAPFWAHYMPYSVRYALCGAFSAASFLLAALCEPVELKLLGVVCAAISSGWGEVTSLAMLAFYKESAVTAWSSGTGFAGVAGAGFYVMFTSAFGISDRTTLLIGLIFPLMYVLCYFVALGPGTVFAEPEPSPSSASDGVPDELPYAAGAPVAGAGKLHQHASSGSVGPGLELEHTEGSDGPGASMVGRPRQGDTTRLVNPPGHGTKKGLPEPAGTRGMESCDATKTMTTAQRLTALRSLLPVMTWLFVVYFAEYTINSGVAGTLSFPNDGLPKHDFYKRAQLVYQAGVFISRSSGQLLPINTLWPMPLGQTIMLVVFIVQSCTQFIGSSWIMFALVLFEGLLGGAVYVNAFRKIRAESPPHLREFYLGAASVADTAGISVASGVSVWLEPFLDGVRKSSGLPVA